tara:strand:- start:845 stop:1747 length:903 start_codon:yes stop_codon:yes gene_type:complete
MSKISSYRVFKAIVDAGGISAAAFALNVSVSSVSKQLKKLESELGVTLISRSTNSISLTGKGRLFYEACDDILSRIDQAERSLRDESGDLAETLTITLSNVLLKTPLIKYLAEFSHCNSGVRFDIRVSDHFENIVEKGMDFAFRIGDLANSRLVANRLASSKIVFCASPDYVDRRGTPSNLAELMHHDLIVPSYVNYSEHMTLLSAEVIQKIKKGTYHSTNDYIALHDCAVNGMGVIFALEMAVDEDLRSGRLIKLGEAPASVSKDLFIVYNRGQGLSDAHRKFKNFVLERFSKLNCPEI